MDGLFEQYKNQIRDEYNSELTNIRTNNETLYNNLKTLLDNKITELTNYANSIEPNIDNYIDEKDQAIKDLITNFQNEFTEYQKNVNAELVELGDTLTQLINTNEQNVINQINNKTTEIINTLSNVNMQELVNDKLNSYDSEELSDLFTNLYGTLIRITYMNTDTPPTLTGTEPIYHYNPDTGVLTNCVNNTAVTLLPNSIYLYEGRLFTLSLSLDFINEIDSDTSVDKYCYQKEDIAVIFGYSDNEILLYNTKTGEVIYNGIAKKENNSSCSVYFVSLLDNILYFVGSGYYIYSFNLDTKEFKDIVEVGFNRGIVAMTNGIYIFNSGMTQLYDFETQQITTVNPQIGNYALQIIPFIDNYYYVSQSNNIYKTNNFIDYEVVYENLDITPQTIFKNNDFYAITNEGKLYNLDKKILLDNTDTILWNSINSFNTNNFNINLFSTDLTNIKSFAFKNPVRLNVNALLNDYIYFGTKNNKMDCYKYSYKLKEIPYQRSGS